MLYWIFIQQENCHIEGVNSSWLFGKIPTTHKKLVQKNNLVKVIKNSSAEVVVMIGAGDIGAAVNEVTNELLKYQENEVKKVLKYLFFILLVISLSLLYSFCF